MDTQETLTQWHSRRPEEAPPLVLHTIPLAKAAEAIERIDPEAADAGVDLVIADTPPGIEDHPKESRLLVDRADYVLVPTAGDTGRGVCGRVDGIPAARGCPGLIPD